MHKQQFEPELTSSISLTGEDMEKYATQGLDVVLNELYEWSVFCNYSDPTPNPENQYQYVQPKGSLFLDQGILFWHIEQFGSMPVLEEGMTSWFHCSAKNTQK